MAQWRAETIVDEGLAGALIAEQFADLAGLPLRLLGAGWDNTVYVVGDEWVFRFPRREVVVPGLQVEIDVLPRLANLLPFAIPVPEHIGRPTAAFPWPFFGARHVPGVELCEAPGVSREALAAQLGVALRALHASRVLEALGERLPDNLTRRADMQLRVPLTVEKLDAIESLWRAPAHVRTLLDDALALAPPEPSAVCHGDLHFRHLLVEGDRITGLIDWIDLCRGDPSIDLQVVWSVLPREARETFFATYGEVSEFSLLRARVVALFLNAALAEYAHDEGLETIEREALASLERAASP